MIRIYALLFVILSFAAGCKSDNKESEDTDSQTGNLTASTSSSSDGYEWTKIADDPGYSSTYNYQMFTKDDKLYVIHPDGGWESSDGKTWSKTGLPDIIKNQGFLDYVQFNGDVYALGTFSGNVFEHVFTTQIARTSDFKKWDILAKESNLPKRFLIHPFVFQNKIWIIGGNDGQTVYNDAWNSSDGVHWEKVADDLPFGTRHSQHFVNFKDQIYMLSYDVWSSKDGINWNQVTTATVDAGDITGFTPMVFDNKIWLIGSNRGGNLGSQVFYSEDGLNWKKQQAPWSPRGYVAACVFKDQLFITGGRYGGSHAIDPKLEYVHDVWALHKQ